MSDPAVTTAATTAIESANAAFATLLAELDRESPYSDSIEQRATRAFHAIIDAITLAEKAGGAEGIKLAQHLFNRAIADLYAFEPVADLAVSQRGELAGQVGLAQLFCAAVAGYAPRPESAEALIADERDEVPDFAPIADFVFAGQPSSVITPDDLAGRLARSAWFYIQWNAHRLKLSIQSGARMLRAEVYEGDESSAGAANLSKGLDGWEIRLSAGRQPAIVPIQSGLALLSLPERIERAQFAIQLRKIGQREWASLYGRTST